MSENTRKRILIKAEQLEEQAAFAYATVITAGGDEMDARAEARPFARKANRLYELAEV